MAEETMIGRKSAPLCLLGALAGDVIGSIYEYNAPKNTEFKLFTSSSRITDDSVLTIAVADAIVNQRTYLDSVREYALKYPGSGYGGYFRQWMYSTNPQPYTSFGNGSAMRVSPVGWAFDTVEETLRQAKASAEITHNHPEGIKGAQAVAMAIFSARNGANKEQIRSEITKRFGYDLSFTLDEIRPTYRFDVTCQKTVPPAIVAFWNQTISRRLSGMPFPLEAMPIPWRLLLARLLKLFTVACREKLWRMCGSASQVICGQ